MKQYKLMGALALTGAFALALSGCAAGNTGSGDNGDAGEKTDVEMANYNPSRARTSRRVARSTSPSARCRRS